MRYGVICFLLVCYIIRTPGVTATRRQERLAGGNVITDYRYPWVVSVGSTYASRSDQNDTFETRCTGSIIDPHGTVITAAHCVEKIKKTTAKTYKLQSVFVKWGSYFSENNTRGIILNLSTIHRHPLSYSVHQKPNKKDIDVALIFLNKFGRDPINCSDPTLKPIKLSTESGTSDPINGIVAGFGYHPTTDQDNVITGYILGHLTELQFIYGGRCSATRNITFYYDEPASSLSSSMFYGFGNPSRDAPFVWYNITAKIRYSGTCKGDSGAPYMVIENGQLRLRGIFRGTSRRPPNDTSPCYRAEIRNHFVDINYNKTRRWITKKLLARYIDIEYPVPGDDIPRKCARYE